MIPRVRALCPCGAEFVQPDPDPIALAARLNGMPCVYCCRPMAVAPDPNEDPVANQRAYDRGQNDGWDAALHVIAGLLDDSRDLKQAKEIIEQAIAKSAKHRSN